MKLIKYATSAVVLIGLTVFPALANAETFYEPLETDSAADFGGQWVPYENVCWNNNETPVEYGLSMIDGAQQNNAFTFDCGPGTDTYIVYTDSWWVY